MSIVSNYIQLKKENKFLKEQNKILTDDNYKFKEEIGRLKESNKSNPKENIKTISDLREHVSILNKKLEESSAECIKLTDDNIKDRDVFQESEKEYKEKINILQQEIYELKSKIKEYEVYYDGRLKKECEKEIKKLKKIITNLLLSSLNISIGFNSDKDIILISEEKMEIKENEFKKALEQLILGDDRNGEEN